MVVECAVANIRLPLVSLTCLMPPITQFKKNLLLASLPTTEWKRWSASLEPVEMPLGQVLYEPGVALNYVYFPLTSIVSLLYVMENGASAEIAVVGNEGIVGVSLFMGGESTPSRAVVQSAGSGCRLKAQLMKDEFNKAGPVLHLLLRYTQALITQMSQTAVCNRHHSLDQQLCRWLLLSRDPRRKQAIVLALDDRVTLARALFESRAIQHRDMPARILDQARFLQAQGAFRNAFAPHPEHIGDQFLRHHEFVAFQAI